MKEIKIIDVHEEAAKYIDSKQTEFKEFINSVILPDQILKKLWLFTFSNDPFNNSSYPLSNKIAALMDIQSSDIELLFDRINENPGDKRFYEYLSLSLLPLYFALFIIQDSPEISLTEIMDDLNQEFIVNYYDQGELNKSCRISNAWPNFLLLHTSSKNREELCIEFEFEFGTKEIQFLDNYAFLLFKKRSNEFDELYWGEGKKEYFITLKSKSKQKTFPAPIFNKHIRLIKELLKNKNITDKIVDVEMGGGEVKKAFAISDVKDKQVIMDSMKRRYFEAALKFQGNGSSEDYFKKVLKGDDEFKKASAIINVEKETGTEKKRILKPKHQHLGGTINSNGQLEKKDTEEDVPAFTPEDLQYDPIKNIEFLISINQIIDLLDNPKDKQFLIHSLQGFTQEEVAEKLKISQSTISRFPEKIKKILK